MNRTERKPKVYLSEYIHPEARKKLERYTEIIDDWSRLNEVEGLIRRNLKTITAETMDSAPLLKVIGIHGTGRDGVDLKAAEERNIRVFSTPGQNAGSVAELNVALTLMLLRKVLPAVQYVYDADGENDCRSEFSGHEAGSRTVGIIGLGKIGKMTAQMLKDGFGTHVIGWSRSLTVEEARSLGIGYCSDFREVLKKADVVILGLALTPQTQGIIGGEELKLMKKDACLINCARGALVDEEALYEALRNRQIAFAAFDVFTKEPVTGDNKLVSLHNFIALPHIGMNTEEALYRVGMTVVDGILKELGVETEETDEQK